MHRARTKRNPAFANLFVETEIIEAKNFILARRRPRSTDEAEIFGAHAVSVSGKMSGSITAETSRAAFLGRGGTLQNPAILSNEQPAAQKSAPSLDQVFSLRVCLIVEPGETASATIATIAADTREQAFALTDKYSAAEAFARAEKLVWTRSHVELRHLNISTDEANLFQRIAGHLIYADAVLRPRAEILLSSTGSQRDLWKYGIGGDLPILLVRVSETGDAIRRLRLLVKAHEYLHAKNLTFDLVVLNEQPATYAQNFADELLAIARGGTFEGETKFDRAGGIFVRRADVMSETDRIALMTAARVVFVTGRGTIEEQLAIPVEQVIPPDAFVSHERHGTYPKPEKTKEKLLFANEFGGFSEDGREYLINLETAWNLPPAPWANVAANEHDFGFLATETGTSATFSQNSRENRLTNWSNDAVGDPPGEIVYLRDELTGSFWSPTALPVRENSPYTVRHGQGYTMYEHTSHGIDQQLLLFAALSGGAKIFRLRLKNLSDRTRRIAAYFYAEPILGVNRAESMPFITTEIDAATGAIFARNPRRSEFGGRVAFAATDQTRRVWTCDRRDFLGRNGSFARPQAMIRATLSGAVGAGLDVCLALQTFVEIEPNETKEVVFLLGEESTAQKARETISRFLQKSGVEREYRNLQKFWDDLLTNLEVATPDAATDLMMNRWLIHQTLACRFRARSAFYQSSGAFGFRDQLQDATALIYARPDLARAHILRAAGRQFREGDVLHWWHEPAARGARTRSSDDLLWLPFVIRFYLEVTNDESVLDELVPFIEAPPLAADQDEAYVETTASSETATVYEHCVRAVERSLNTGNHGLPLIGTGDWSDGLTRVGNRGRGESIWLGWFLIVILRDFSAVCRRCGDAERARRWRKRVAELKKNLDRSGWDGEWYRWAYSDDGAPLGSKESAECKIDAIAQSWSVISGAGDEIKMRRAMRAVEEFLVKREKKLSLLLAPPFDKTPLDPGYIKAYPPGVRENGGQYTHAAAWNVIAFVLLGEAEKAFENFEFLNPINHARTAEQLKIYKTEPYAVAADIYGGEFAGRGGWTWYTGAAGWMYRAMLEYILGFKKRGNRHFIAPCIPREWREYRINYRFGESFYRIVVENPHGATGGIAHIEIDGKISRKNHIVLSGKPGTHLIRVTLGAPDLQKAREERIFTESNLI